MSSKIPTWIQKFLLPELESIKGELRAMNTRINEMEKRLSVRIQELDKRVESLRNEMVARFETVNSRIDSLEKSWMSRRGSR